MIVLDYTDKLIKHDSKTYRRRPVGQITDVIIHHSGNNGSVEAHARWHVGNNDWPALSYHYFIELSGSVIRCNDIDRLTYHCGGNNARSIGICLNGDFDKNEPTIEQLESLRKLLEAIHVSIGQYTLGYHGQYKSTTCCGEKLIQKIYHLTDYESSRWTLKE